MSFVYLANQTNIKGTPLFEQKGIPNKAPSVVSDVNTLLIPLSYYNTSYQLALHDLNGLIRSQLGNSVIARNVGTVENYFSRLPATPDIALPTLCVEAQDEDVDALKRMGFVESQGLYFAQVSRDEYVKVLGLKTVKNPRYSPGSVTTQALGAYYQALRFVNLFSFLSKVYGTGLQTFLIRDVVPDSVAELVVGTKNVVVEPGSQKGLKLDLGVPAKETILASGKVMPIFVSTEPSGLIPPTHISITGTIPVNSHARGLIFPYFPGLCLPDRDIIGRVLAKYITRSIGNSLDVCQAKMAEIRTGSRQLSFSPAGLALSHFFKGIELAVECSGHIIMITDGSRYFGFVLLGDFKILVGSTVHETVPIATLQKDLVLLDVDVPARNNLKKAVEVVMTMDGNPKHTLNINEDFVSSRILFRRLSNISWGDYTDAQRRDVVLAADKIYFFENFPKYSIKLFSTFINFVHTGNMALIDSFPAYIRDGLFMEPGRIPEAVSIFGPQAPSLISSSGTNKKVFSLPLSSTATDPNLVKTNGIRPLPFLPLKIKPIRAAHDDWRNVFNNGVIQVSPPPKNSKGHFAHRKSYDHAVDGKNFDTLYALIKRISEEQRMAKKGGKRARDDTAEAGSSKRTRVDNSAMIGDGF